MRIYESESSSNELERSVVVVRKEVKLAQRPRIRYKFRFNNGVQSVSIVTKLRGVT